jgi:serine/threonine protein kinase
MRLVQGKLQHTSIDVYLALELCTAGDLHALKGQMTAKQIQQLIAQIVSGVQYLHSLKVWHRDLKSANILLTVQDGRQVLKIADLGAAPLKRLKSVTEDFSSWVRPVASVVTGALTHMHGVSLWP